MVRKKKSKKCEWGCGCSRSGCTGSGGIYFLGFIGALVYNISVATGFWSGVLGVLKALIWPAYVVFKLMGFLGL
jgi:hypothetical protein